MVRLELAIALTLIIAYPVFALSAEEESNLKEVYPQAARFKHVKSGDYYKAYASDGAFIGVAFKAAQKGYAGDIETMVGMKKDGTITAIKVLDQDETPGVGARITEPDFAGQFRQRNLRDLDGVEAVTGATISSKAVIDSVKNQAARIMPLIKEEK